MEERIKRKGPIGFHAESKATTQSSRDASNPGGIGEASLTRETPTRSKELRVMGNGWIALMGILLTLIGLLLLAPFIVIAGAVVSIGAYLGDRINRTERRLRSDFEAKEQA